jgi:hypothetical protein
MELFYKLIYCPFMDTQMFIFGRKYSQALTILTGIISRVFHIADFVTKNRGTVRTMSRVNKPDQILAPQSKNTTKNHYTDPVRVEQQ